MDDDIRHWLEAIQKTLQYRLAAEYTARYQQIVMQLPPGILFHGGELDLKDDWADDSRVVSVLHAYVDLCAEEVRMYHSGQIPADVWQSWSEGIRAGFHLPAVQHIWEDFFESGPYAELRQFLQEDVQDST